MPFGIKMSPIKKQMLSMGEEELLGLGKAAELERPCGRQDAFEQENQPPPHIIALGYWTDFSDRGHLIGQWPD